MSSLPSPRSNDPDVLEEVARQFGIREFGAGLTSWLGFCLLAFAVRDAVPAQRIGVWLACHVLLESMNLIQSWRLQQPGLDVQRRNRLLRNLTLTITLDGLTWGLAPFIMAVPGDPMYTMLYVLFLTCACTMSIHGLSMHLPAMVGFSTPMVMPMAISLMLDNDRVMRTMGIGAALIWLMSLFYSRISSRLTIQAIVANVRNQDLARTLQTRNEELNQALTTINELAQRDPLTNCLNRRALLERVNFEMERHDREGRPMGLLLIDLDHFKRINDQYGHLAGDDVLKVCAQRLTRALQEPDFPARYGGEEFACVLSVGDMDELHRAAERIRFAIAEHPIVLEDQRQVQITASIGAALRQPGESMNTLARRADEALYRAKNAGRDRVTVAPPSVLHARESDLSVH